MTRNKTTTMKLRYQINEVQELTQTKPSLLGAKAHSTMCQQIAEEALLGIKRVEMLEPAMSTTEHDGGGNWIHLAQRYVPMPLPVGSGGDDGLLAPGQTLLITERMDHIGCILAEFRARLATCTKSLNHESN